MDVHDALSFSVSAGSHLLALKEEVQNIRGDVDARLTSIELQITRYAQRDSSHCQLLVDMEPCSSAAPQFDQLSKATQDLQDRLQRLELLLFCIPVPNFKDIDNAIQHFMKSSSAKPSIVHGVAKTEISPRIVTDADSDARGQLLKVIKSDSAALHSIDSIPSIPFEAEPAVAGTLSSVNKNAAAVPVESCAIQDAFTSMLQAQTESNVAPSSSAAMQVHVLENMMSDMKEFEEAEERLRMLHAITEGFGAFDDFDTEASKFLNEM